MKKIALLAYARVQALHMFNLQKHIIDLGHKCDLFYQEDYIEEPNRYKLMWEHSWDTKLLNGYDKVVIFNGYAKETYAHTTMFKATLKDKIWFAEKAWFPQRDFIYLDPDGLGGRSRLAQMFTFNGESKDIVDEILSKHYSFVNAEKYKGCSLIPLQLDHDTSILYDSPTFKTMKSFLSCLCVAEKYIVKAHPLSKNPVPYSHPNLEYNTEIPTISIARVADKVVGINSTTLLEAMMFECDVFLFGKSVMGPVRWGDGTVNDGFATISTRSTYKKRRLHISTLYRDYQIGESLPLSERNILYKLLS